MLRRSGAATVVARNSHATVSTVPVTGGTGPDEPFILVERPDSVAACVRNETGAFLLVRQHRFAADLVGWELPQGAMEPGETWAAAAARELAEEAGLAPRRSGRLIARLFEAADWCTGACYAVSFEAVEPTGGAPELETAWFDAERVAELAAGGDIVDGITLAVVFLGLREEP
jgi:8-oxo-dGTP pyrophosphatase MutT (NUDIX family)